jgi:iron complex outermembrane receptor protein
VLDQVGLVGRSVSFSLLPSELVSQVIVRKSATADLTEGGVAGAVDIITRRPLQFTKPVTLEAFVGGVYADLPRRPTAGQRARQLEERRRTRMGVLVQASPRSATCAATARRSWATRRSRPPARSPPRARPRQRLLPTLIGSALFEQERERKGG